MEYRALGSTGLKLSALGFGCGAVGGLLVKGEYPAMRRAVQRQEERATYAASGGTITPYTGRTEGAQGVATTPPTNRSTPVAGPRSTVGTLAYVARH